MAKPKRKRRRGLRKGLSLFWAAISVMAAAAAVILASTIFFKTGSIAVTGTAKLDQAAVIDASGLKTGGNLFLTKTDKAVERIKALFPYAQSVKIKRQLPDTLVIQIDEAVPAAYTEHEGTMWLISRTGTLLEAVDASALQGFPVTGCVLDAPEEGKNIAGSAGADISARNLVKLMEILWEKDALGLVNGIDVSKSYEITFRYDGRFDVNIGTMDDLDYKIEYFISIVENLSGSDKGSIDVSSSPGRFIPA